MRQGFAPGRKRGWAVNNAGNQNDLMKQIGPLFLIAMIAVVVGVGSLLGAALVLGAFDSRVHDTDDIARLGLPVLGHVPGFPGDALGSLEARGVQRGRVPLFRRWRS